MHRDALSEADRFLLEAVRRGDAEGWSQLVTRYRGRLLAFARKHSRNDADAEDLVQESFIRFLRGLAKFRGEASLETYLFTILRRRIIDAMRGARLKMCQIAESRQITDRHAAGFTSDEPTASWYARRDEEHEAHVGALAVALGELVEDFKQRLAFRDLELAETLFYAQLRNQEAARLTGATESQVGLKKHRWIAEVRGRIKSLLPQAAGPLWESPEMMAGMIGEAWESRRLSCPKRSTLGRYLLGTLDPQWQQYVTFHAQLLGCSFCGANLQDMQPAPESDGAGGAGVHRSLDQKIFQSTVGFFRS